MATGIRLACLGYKVTVFEKNPYPGGKLSELNLGKYRFDKGPSLLTLPELITELKSLSGFGEEFRYQRLDVLTHYFFEDGSTLKASASPAFFAEELSRQFGEDKKKFSPILNAAGFIMKVLQIFS